MDHNIHCSTREHCPLEHASSAFQSFDTVRALHQSVLCLRAALENAHKEIDTLKKQISVQTDVKEGKIFRETLGVQTENTEGKENLTNIKKADVNTIPERKTEVETQKTDEVIVEDEQKTEDTKPDHSLRAKRRTRRDYHKSEKRTEQYDFSKSTFVPDIRIVTNPSASNKSRKQMASKIDVKIKLSSNVNVDSTSSGTAEDSNSNSGSDSAPDSELPDEQPENLESLNITEQTTNVSTNTPAHDIEVIAPEEEASKPNCEETLENQTKQSEDISTEEQVRNSTVIARSLRHSTTSSEANEEVDDIELIFSSDDKEHLQEDLVSISDFEPWEKAGSTGTPILVNFNALSSSEELNNKSKNKKSVGMSMETDEEGLENQSDMKRDESVDAFEQVENTAVTTGLGRRWTNHNVLIETDISKCGIAEDTVIDMGRRNTCPNPPSYRPLMHRETLAQAQAQSRHSSTRCPLAVKFSRNSRTHYHHSNRSARPILQESNKCEPKRSSSAQTEISALPEHWQSESNLISGRYGDGFYTLPSKFVPPPSMGKNRRPSQMTDKTQDARRVMLSDINFTSMVPELSRSADHLCQDDEYNGNGNESSYYKGNHLQTPDYSKGITPSASMTSPGVSQWTVNENSFGTQTTQTDNFWNNCDSFDSSKSYTMGSRFSTILNKSHRSRSVPSIQCSICKQNHGRIRASESMHYTPRVTFREPTSTNSVRGSLPDLRNECTCMHRRTCGRPSLLRLHTYSSGSTESLLDEADDYLNKSVDGMSNFKEDRKTSEVNRRRSENDIKRDYSPSKQSLPFLPKSPKCLKLGHLAKVITKSGRVVIGRVRYIGPLASTQFGEDECFVGLQLPNSLGDCDGTIEGRKFFDCEPQHGIFVPFHKIVMAWTA
ncbi:uncharacterized protein LOC119085126 [Bradysia coprophila]|uniref:uncharacterized protein LOC119085126 n=1 Tax=Bradysia coprophila TaxID=38358 RepID=UPI00187D8094|nr:uncharacterized protein LOC119085126 [Bradysia coprophila]XP_037051289.1 uncharacterized protein LOC119085126 [Bradysia coprophila]